MLNLAKTYLLMALTAISLLALVSCDKHLFDDEGDCEVTHIIKFRYELNLKWADAFPSEVNSVNLYVFDSNGVFVKEYTGRGEEVNDPDYHIVLDLPMGDYKFLAWCGLANDVRNESFTVPQPIAGVTTIEEMTCALNTQRTSLYSRADADAPVYSNERLYFMFYGYLEASLVDTYEGGQYVHTIYLTKDTNHIRIILQELNGDDLRAEDYAITIEDDNGLLSWNNELLGDTKITYEPWFQTADEVGVGRIDMIEGNGLTYVKGLVADLSSSRLMATHKNRLMLTITNRRLGEVIARVPLLQYALLSKEYYEMAYGHTMTDQEFLDREDEYIMTFFLINGRWMDAYINILSWRVVLHNYDLGY